MKKSRVYHKSGCFHNGECIRFQEGDIMVRTCIFPCLCSSTNFEAPLCVLFDPPPLPSPLLARIAWLCLSMCDR